MVWPAEAASVGLGGRGFPCSAWGQWPAGEGTGSGRAYRPGPLTPGLIAAKLLPAPWICHLSHVHTVGHLGSVCIITVHHVRISSG